MRGLRHGPRNRGRATDLPAFELELRWPASPDVVWRRLWDLDRHTRSIPLTQVAAEDGRPLHAASSFTGRTRAGRWGFDDHMVVREWQPPRRAVVDKVGPNFRGTITVTLRPEEGGTRLLWHQTYGAVAVPPALTHWLAPLLRRAYTRSLRRILALG